MRLLYYLTSSCESPYVMAKAAGLPWLSNRLIHDLLAALRNENIGAPSDSGATDLEHPLHFTACGTLPSRPSHDQGFHLNRIEPH